jgi:outer membrane autotransporter protein
MRAAFLFHALIFGFVFIKTSELAFAQPLVVTIEAPAVQRSSFSTNPSAFRASNVVVEPFDELTPGFISKPVPFAGNAALGSYDHLLVVSADAFGGAGGKGTYMMVSTNVNKASSPTTLTLATPQRYFGIWWSAGDPNNVLSFYSRGTLIETFRTSDVVNFIEAQANARAFNGNPNTGQNKGKPYAFLNFYADPSNPNLTFDLIVFSNNGGARFQQDNQTIAATYTDISGMDIDPTTPIQLGGNPNSNDTIGAEGSGSTLTDLGETAIIGGSGTGELDIKDGGTVIDGGTMIGQNPGSSGTVDVMGPGSSLQDSGNAVIGQGGSGALDITNGGTVTDTNATVGAEPGSSGTVIVDGNGSEWRNSGTLDVGPSGSGVLDIADGGKVTADGGTTVGPNGTIMGDGTITTPTLTNDGLVMPTGPNGTPGTLTENGNYQQGSNGKLDIGVGGNQSSRSDELLINGTANLNGTLELTPLNNFHPTSGTTFEILHAANGVNGNFSQVADTLNTSGLTRVEILTPNGVVISYLALGVAPLILTTSTPVPATLTNANAILVPALNPNLQQLSTPFEVWFSLANTQRFNIQNRFDDIIAGSTGFVSNVSYPKPPPTGKEIVEGKGAVEGKGKEVVPPVLQPSPENRWGVWVTGYGDFTDVDDDGPRRGYNYTTGGVTVGIDYRPIDHVVIGLMGGYAHTWTDLKPSGSVGVDTGWGGMYGGYFNHGFYILAAAFGGQSSFDTDRPALLGGHAKGNSDGQVWSTFVSGGYDFQFGHLTIGPVASLQYSNEHLNGFSETGSIAPVAVSSDSEETWRTDVGFRAWHKFQVGGIGIRPFVRAAWEHDFNEGALPVSARLVDIPGAPVTIFGPRLGHDSAIVNAGVSVDWTKTISAYVSYDGQLGRDRYDSNGVSGGFRIAF